MIKHTVLMVEQQVVYQTIIMKAFLLCPRYFCKDGTYGANQHAIPYNFANFSKDASAVKLCHLLPALRINSRTI